MTDDPFDTHRNLFFTVAYEMLGSAADAEDVVQETWLRWAGVDATARESIHDARAYLVRIVTRQALNRLRTLSRQREDYIGEWLPEPLLTSPDITEDIELVEHVSVAMLVVLETLGPVERAVFVLREVFDVPYDEIAETVHKSPAAVRQIAHRARLHVAARRPRVTVSRAEQDVVVGRFLAALGTGNVQSLMEVLTPDVALVADGGGYVPASRRPITGIKRVAAVLANFPRLAPGATIDTIFLNGGVAVRIELAGQGSAVVAFVFEKGRIARLYVVGNPHKLGWLDEEIPLSRTR